MTSTPSNPAATNLHPAERDARAIFARVLSQWTMDMIHLRSLGLHEPVARAGDGGIVLPPWPGFDGPSAYSAPKRMSVPDMKATLRWKPTANRTAA